MGVELNNSKNIKFIIANIDHGVGIVKCEKNFQYKKMNDILKDKEFKSFYFDYYQKLPIVNAEKALLFIKN